MSELNLTEEEKNALREWLENDRRDGYCPFDTLAGELFGAPEHEEEFQREYCLRTCGIVFPEIVSKTGDRMICPCGAHSVEMVTKKVCEIVY